MKDLKTKWLPLATVVASLWVGGITNAHAIACVAENGITEPDATVTHAVACGSGTTVENYDELNVQSVENVAGYDLNWSLLEEVSVESRDRGTNLTFTGTETGNWYLSTELNLNTNAFLLVIKDGGVSSGQGQERVESPKWFWFILDEITTSPIACGASDDLCGTWSMYGDGGDRKDISHMRIYTAVTEGGGGGQTDVPEPGPLSLVGLGLMGLWFARRKTNA